MLFLKKCIVCNRIISDSSLEFICFSCIKELEFLPVKIYKRDNMLVDNIICVFKYNLLMKKAIANFKYYNHPNSFKGFGNLISKNLILTGIYKDIDCIIPVPLHKKRYKERGYNQSYLLGKQISKELDIALYNDVLTRVKNTPKQAELNREQRLKNLDNAFTIKKKEKIKNKKVLIIDDVFTTGSTINECTKALKQSGAIKVDIAVITSGNISGE